MNGRTLLKSSDKIVICDKSTENITGVQLFERKISNSDPLCNKKLKEIKSTDKLIIMVKRGEQIIIPDGNTSIRVNDTIIINESN